MTGRGLSTILAGVNTTAAARGSGPPVSLLVSALGIGDVAGKYFVPQLGAFLIYLLLVAILFVRPQGLFGRR